MDADATGDVRAGDRERARGRQGRVERADHPVLEDHAATLATYPAVVIARRLFLVAVVLLASACLGASAPAAAETPDGRVVRVLFVGNSLTATNDLPAAVAALARASGRPRIEYKTIAPGGVSLEDHWNANTAPAELASGGWDAVVLQQGPSALLESQVNLKEWATRFADAAREHGTRPFLLTVWPESYRVGALDDVIKVPCERGESRQRAAPPCGCGVARRVDAEPGAAALRAGRLSPEPARNASDGGRRPRRADQDRARVAAVPRPGLTVTRARARLLHDAAVKALAAAR